MYTKPPTMIRRTLELQASGPRRHEGKKKRKGKTAQGAEAWKRYASFVTEQQLVLHLEGERLRRVLDGNRAALEEGSGFPLPKGTLRR